MKARNTIQIGNKTFTVQHSKYAKVSNLLYASGRTLDDCYTRPSATKQSIYWDWLMWANDNNVQYFGVRSYNSNMFTLQGMVEIDGLYYILEITPTRNTAYIPV